MSAWISASTVEQASTYAIDCIRVGVFATLTNSYALVAIGASENFYRSAPHSPWMRLS